MRRFGLKLWSKDFIKNKDFVNNAEKAIKEGKFDFLELYALPFIFDEIRCRLDKKSYTPPTVSEKIDVALEHIKLLCLEKGEETGIKESRKHIGHYAKGLKASAQARQRLNFANTYDEIYDILCSLAKENQ